MCAAIMSIKIVSCYLQKYTKLAMNIGSNLVTKHRFSEKIFLKKVSTNHTSVTSLLLLSPVSCFPVICDFEKKKTKSNLYSDNRKGTIIDCCTLANYGLKILFCVNERGAYNLLFNYTDPFNSWACLNCLFCNMLNV